MRRVGREVAGAWRSLQYDMARRPEPVAVDVTTDVLYPEYEASERPRRKLLAATTFGMLSLAGAAGTYFAVVNGLAALPTEEPAGQPHALPAVAPSTPVGAAPQPAATPGTPPATAQVGTATTTAPRKPSPRPAKPAPGGVVAPPAPSPTCACVTPPVPRPTNPPPATTPPPHSPSPTPADPTTPPPDPTESPTP